MWSKKEVKIYFELANAEYARSQPKDSVNDRREKTWLCFINLWSTRTQSTESEAEGGTCARAFNITPVSRQKNWKVITLFYKWNMNSHYFLLLCEVFIHSLGRRGWPWVPDPPVSTSRVLRLQVGGTLPSTAHAVLGIEPKISWIPYTLPMELHTLHQNSFY